MHMYYWFGTEFKDFLFYGYNIITTQCFISTLIGLIALAILYEAMKLSQVKLYEYAKESDEIENQAQNIDSSSLISETLKSKYILKSPQCYSQTKWLLELGHWSMHVVIGYFFMLTVMTFNGYITIALAIGSGIGYYVFGPILVEMNIRKFKKQCKIVQDNSECIDVIVSTERRNSTNSEVSQQAEVNIQVDVDLHC
ncbi:high affinity copper uptake protein 1-like [Phymastichus coffea]|uniref:high affinity copper uptake protein 1-like n=1 Tax=Phymastichus coffea TaxID=108790 RepID=UPI00273B8A62|nr:high affinity copper uptake protein 1-like [Phymastichus coffea]XP_058791748.1 high affinity copper uptake protein 1-like [Phymastichus coffea]